MVNKNTFSVWLEVFHWSEVRPQKKKTNHQGGLILVLSNEFQMLNFTLQMLIQKLHGCYLALY